MIWEGAAGWGVSAAGGGLQMTGPGFDAGASGRESDLLANMDIDHGPELCKATSDASLEAD